MPDTSQGITAAGPGVRVASHNDKKTIIKKYKDAWHSAKDSYKKERKAISNKLPSGDALLLEACVFDFFSIELRQKITFTSHTTTNSPEFVTHSFANGKTFSVEAKLFEETSVAKRTALPPRRPDDVMTRSFLPERSEKVWSRIVDALPQAQSGPHQNIPIVCLGGTHDETSLVVRRFVTYHVDYFHKNKFDVPIVLFFELRYTDYCVWGFHPIGKYAPKFRPSWFGDVPFVKRLRGEAVWVSANGNRLRTYPYDLEMSLDRSLRESCACQDTAGTQTEQTTTPATR